MKLALVTTPWGAPSPVGAFAETLARELADRLELSVFVERGRHGGEYLGRTTRAADELVPREFEALLYQLGNEREHAFMARMVRALGGCIALHDWGLRELAFAAHPELELPGWRGLATALREGGWTAARRLRASGASSVAAELVLNRSIVRFGDAFIVESERLKQLILDDRNAPTPIGVVRRESGASENAARYIDLLERFPPPRSARKGLIAMQIAAALRSRSARSRRTLESS